MPSSSTSAGRSGPSRRRGPGDLRGHEEEGIGRGFPQLAGVSGAAGQPEEVRAKDFPDKQLGKAIPEGVYDLGGNEGWVSVGVDHDTAEFAVESIRRWWQEMGRRPIRGPVGC